MGIKKMLKFLNTNYPSVIKNINEEDVYLTLDQYNQKFSKNKKKAGYIETI